MLHVNTIRFITENDNLTEEQFETFIGESNSLTFETFLNQLDGDPRFSDNIITELTSIYQNIVNLTDIDDCINYIDDKIAQINNSNSSEESNFINILLQGYNNILNYKLTDNTISSRDCVQTCVINNTYNWIWWLHYNLYADSNPWLCSGWGFICPFAASYASSVIEGWCQNECAGQPPVDPCYGISCIPGYHCVDGDCVLDPFAEPECENNGDCPPGEQCFRGTCMPW